MKLTDNKKKNLVKNTVMLYILTFSSYFFNLITVPYQTRVLGPEIYGNIGFAIAFVSYFRLLFDFGFILSATETVSKNRENKIELGKTISAVNAVKTFFILASTLLLIILLLSVDRFHSDPLLYILFFIYISIDAFLPDFLYRGLENMKIITYRSVIIRLFFTLLIFVFLKEPSQYYVIPILYILGSIFAVASVYLHIHFKLKIKHRKVEKKYIFKTFKKSGLFFLSRIATTLYGSTNTVVLGFIYPTGPTVGLYTSANKITTTAQSAMSPISDSVYPYMVKNKDFKLIKKVLLIFEPIVLIGCIGIGIFAEPICTIFFGNEYAGAAPILRIMLVTIAVTLPNYILGFPTMTPLGISKYANYSVMIAAGWQVLSLLFLFMIGSLNLYSICAATAITECFVLILRISFIKKRNKLLRKTSVL